MVEITPSETELGFVSPSQLLCESVGALSTNEWSATLLHAFYCIAITSGLAENRVRDEGACSLAHVLESSDALTHVDLSSVWCVPPSHLRVTHCAVGAMFFCWTKLQQIMRCNRDAFEFRWISNTFSTQRIFLCVVEISVSGNQIERGAQRG